LPDDYDVEVRLIADQSDESERRVRARLEKRGLMDTLRNQIIERKVIELITASAAVADVPFEKPAQAEFAIDVAVTTATNDSEIPEAKHGEAGNDALMPSPER
jgi:trigger factor